MVGWLSLCEWCRLEIPQLSKEPGDIPKSSGTFMCVDQIPCNTHPFSSLMKEMSNIASTRRVAGINDLKLFPFSLAFYL